MTWRAIPFALASFFVVGSAHAANRCVDAATNAQNLRSASKLVEARAELLVCVQKSCNPVVRSDCEKWMKEVDDATPSVVIRVTDARGADVLDATVTIDDTPVTLDGTPVAIDPGQRVIKVRTGAADPIEQRTLIAQGEKSRVIEVKLETQTSPTPIPEAPKPERSNVVPITLAAIGGAALVSFVIFEALGQSGHSHLQDTCGKAGCSEDAIDPEKTKFVVAGVSLGISVVALAAAAVVYFTRKSPSPTALAPFTYRF